MYAALVNYRRGMGSTQMMYFLTTTERRAEREKKYIYYLVFNFLHT